MKAIIFDLGNVLIFFDPFRAARRFAREAKVPLVKVFTHFFISRAEKDYTRGEMTSRQFFEHARRAFRSRIDYATFRHLWNDIFTPNRRILPLLKKLSRQYPLYLISNTNELHFNHVRKTYPEFFRYFRKTFPSHQMGCRKPEAKIYRKVLAAIHLRPEEALFIDDVGSFVKAARKVGMHALQFKNNQQLKKDLRRLLDGQ